MELDYHKTARKTKPNKIMREEIVPFFKQKNVESVLDFGCGPFLRDSLYLARRGFVVCAVDLPEQIKRVDVERALSEGLNSVSSKIPLKQYDAAMLNFVIQVIEEPKKRIDLLKMVCEPVRQEGYLVLSARRKEEVERTKKPSWKPLNDGYVTMQNTFVRGYEQRELEEVLLSLEMKPIKTYKTSSSLITLNQKKRETYK